MFNALTDPNARRVRAYDMLVELAKWRSSGTVLIQYVRADRQAVELARYERDLREIMTKESAALGVRVPLIPAFERVIPPNECESCGDVGCTFCVYCEWCGTYYTTDDPCEQH